jgi:hypothetical protein
MSLKKFLAKHSGELANIADVLGSIVAVLPIDRQDKARLGGLIAGLGNAAENIAKSAATATETPVNRADLKAAVLEALPDMAGGIAEQVFRLAKDEADKGGKPAPAPKPATAEKTPRAKRRERAAKAGS